MFKGYWLFPFFPVAVQIEFFPKQFRIPYALIKYKFIDEYAKFWFHPFVYASFPWMPNEPPVYLVDAKDPHNGGNVEPPSFPVEPAEEQLEISRFLSQHPEHRTVRQQIPPFHYLMPGGLVLRRIIPDIDFQKLHLLQQLSEVRKDLG